ncbi:somatomedin-B and thrombospondin type-1 domain-containing protein isoform X1 [Homo sapiens]|uniref:somatomedin-B and thrombospondin type-1 domain-containing protein isoform X1 n=1 Tax=Homo sapiens TaxID=9606 RepID=UPI001FB04F17|nr:somatomedin-B and thrombospondin type-1 domain-containing protein isoform X1 [Homo sapiens]XP_054215837.1 somatomedin-B and thrombospondin type-1 domain-containing protein isoform X1 [Homo sapiens]
MSGIEKLARASWGNGAPGVVVQTSASLQPVCGGARCSRSLRTAGRPAHPWKRELAAWSTPPRRARTAGTPMTSDPRPAFVTPHCVRGRYEILKANLIYFHVQIPAFITTSAFNKERTRQATSPHWSTHTEDAGYCMEFKTESLTPHCALENWPLTRWMQYLREGYTVCVDCQPPAMNSVSLRCSGDGLDSDGNQTLHWQAIGNPRCQGTWKKVRRVDQCSCPAVHSFIFI